MMGTGKGDKVDWNNGNRSDGLRNVRLYTRPIHSKYAATLSRSTINCYLFFFFFNNSRLAEMEKNNFSFSLSLSLARGAIEHMGSA